MFSFSPTKFLRLFERKKTSNIKFTCFFFIYKIAKSVFENYTLVSRTATRKRERIKEQLLKMRKKFWLARLQLLV